MTLNERLKALMEAYNGNNPRAITRAMLDLDEWRELKMETATCSLDDLEGLDSDCLKMMICGYLAVTGIAIGGSLK